MRQNKIIQTKPTSMCNYMDEDIGKVILQIVARYHIDIIISVSTIVIKYISEYIYTILLFLIISIYY
jgi:fructose/tagatose bisphosphate aldolase